VGKEGRKGSGVRAREEGKDTDGLHGLNFLETTGTAIPYSKERKKRKEADAVVQLLPERGRLLQGIPTASDSAKKSPDWRISPECREDDSGSRTGAGENIVRSSSKK